MYLLKKQVIVRDDIDQTFSYPGVTYTFTVSTVKILSVLADRPIQTEETKIRLLVSNRSDQGLQLLFHLRICGRIIRWRNRSNRVGRVLGGK